MSTTVVDTQSLVKEGVITQKQADKIVDRGRQTMVQLAVNIVLCFGIFAATGGLIFWLAKPLPVAAAGLFLGAGGLFALSRNSDNFRFFGNAAALIGAGLLIGGAGIELIDKYESAAGPILTFSGAAIAAICFWRWQTKALTSRFVLGTIFLMGLTAHLIGLGFWLQLLAFEGIVKSLFMAYAAVLIAFAGWLLDVRFVTALAIIPFAQILETGTGYFGAIYAFWSPESTLSIISLALLVAVLWWALHDRADRDQRHGRVLSQMAFIVANLCALVGSLWGDWVGETIWGPKREYDGQSYDEWRDAQDAFRDSALHISADVYSVLWAVVLVLLIFFASKRGLRGLFNASVTFAAIHAYTQLFESFADEPLAYVIGGIAAIMLAWFIWRLNQNWFIETTNTAKTKGK